MQNNFFCCMWLALCKKTVSSRHVHLHWSAVDCGQRIQATDLREHAHTEVIIPPDSVDRLIRTEVAVDESPVIRGERMSANACKCIRRQLPNKFFKNDITRHDCVTNAEPVGGCEPPLLTLCSMCDFKGPTGCTDCFPSTVQSCNSAREAVNKM